MSAASQRRDTMSTETALAVIAAHGYALDFGSAQPAMRCAEDAYGDVYAAADLATLAYCARTYELCPCGHHYDNEERS